jgi:hypothetical protein
MPNWCANAVAIKANTKENKDKLFNFVDNNENQKGLFETFQPLKNSETKVESIEWGTKWSEIMEDLDYDPESETLYAWFNTAWSPPIQFYKKMKEDGYLVTAAFAESGVGFMGFFDDGKYCEKKLALDINEWFTHDPNKYEVESFEDNYQYYLDMMVEEFLETNNIELSLLHTGN